LKTPAEFLDQVHAKFGNRPAVSVYSLDPSTQKYSWNTVTGQELKTQTSNLIERLSTSGVGSDSRVALLGQPSVLWIETYLASLSRHAMLCPLDPKLNSQELEKILSHFKPTHLIVDTSLLNDARKFFCVREHRTTLMSFDELSVLPVFTNAKTRAPSTEHWTVIYTSGTSGDPKAVKISFEAMMQDCEAIIQITDVSKEIKTAFSILPLNHLYGLNCGLFFSLNYGLEYCTTQSLLPEHIREILSSKKIGLILVVPLFLKMIFNRVMAQVKSGPQWKALLFKVVLKINQRLHSTAISNLFFAPIIKSLGGNIEVVVAGGAPLEPQVQKFFEGLSWDVFNGYGLTETGPVIAVNSYAFSRTGSVGKPLPGVEVKIVKDAETELSGEICVRGPILFSGYYLDEELTKKSMTADHWFKTGDLGHLDRDGFLFIDGRIKSMIVLASGKKVQPEEIEGLLTSVSFVKEACVISKKDAVSGERIIAIVQLHETTEDATAALRALCQQLSPYKRPHEFILREADFPMTSSMKVKRKFVQDEYQ
jgi:long-chain acyl-CoA synthetase